MRCTLSTAYETGKKELIAPIILAHRKDTYSERAGKVLDLFRYRSFGLDVFVLKQSELQELKDTNEGEWDLVLEILEQGKVLYERQDPTPGK